MGLEQPAPRDAAGLRHLREGFAFDGEGDRDFALGAPHRARLCEDADDPGRVARAILEKGEAPKVWPRRAAGRLVRAAGVFATKLNAKGTRDLLPDGKKAIGADVDRAAAEAVVVAQFTGPFPTALDVPELVFLVEALFGAEAAADAVTRGLEALAVDRLTSHEFPLREAARVTGFLLLRVGEASAARRRARLAAVLARGLGKAKLGKFDGATGSMSVVRGLDLALHGREGAERSGNRVGRAVEPRDLLLVHDDAAWVAAELARGGPPTKHHRPDARLAFLGGDAALAHQVEGWKKFPSALDVLEAFAPVRSERVVEMMLEMSAAPKTKAAALAWLRQRRDFAEPLVRASSSAAAKAALAALKR